MPPMDVSPERFYMAPIDVLKIRGPFPNSVPSQSCFLEHKHIATNSVVEPWIFLRGVKI